MRPYSAPFVANRLHMPVKDEDFGFDSNLFHEFPDERGGERLADFDAPARQVEMAKQRRSRPAKMSARPCRNTAADTTTIGRAGKDRSFMGLAPAPMLWVWSGNRRWR
jgi:hypothetical protein